MKWGSTQSHSTELALMIVLHFTESYCWLKNIWTLLALIKEKWNEPPRGHDGIGFSEPLLCSPALRCTWTVTHQSSCWSRVSASSSYTVRKCPADITEEGGHLSWCIDCISLPALLKLQLLLIRRLPLPPFVVSFLMPQWLSCEYSLLQK